MNKLTYRLIGAIVLFALTFGSYINTGASSAQAALAAVTTYYVSTSGNDANGGTSSAPFKTIQKCANVAASGGTCSIAAGTYSERVTVSREGIVFQANGLVTMLGFTITGNNNIVRGFYVLNSTNREGGIVIKGTGNKVQNNKVERATLVGIQVQGNNLLVENNEVLATLERGTGDADGIRFFGDGNVIRGNYVHDLTYQAGDVAHRDCFQTWATDSKGVATNTLIEGNTCINMQLVTSGLKGQGFMMDGSNKAKNIIIRNNLIRAHQSYILNISGLTIENNTWQLYLASSLVLQNDANAVVRNNLFYRPANSGAVGADIAKCCTYIQPAIFDNNWSYRDDGRYYTGRDEAIPVDRRGVNPLFVNAAAGDFHLQASSPVCGFGAFPCGGVPSKIVPTPTPSKAPTIVPSFTPTLTWTNTPVVPSATPLSVPSIAPTNQIPAWTATPTASPTLVSPTATQTLVPTAFPTSTQLPPTATASPVSGLPTTALYVSASGNDANGGTSSAPFKTIQKCANVAASGSTCSIAAGTYSERVTISRAGIVFQANGLVTMLGFTITGNNNIVRGFYVLNSTNGEGGIVIKGTGNKVQNNKVEGATLVGIQVQGNNLLVENNEVLATLERGTGDADGIRFFGDGNVIRGNYIHDLTYQAGDVAHRDCFQTWATDSKGVATNTLIEGNTCINMQYLTSSSKGQGFMMDGSNKANNIIIRNNVIRAHQSYILNISGLTIENNTWQLYLASSLVLQNDANAVVRNNLFYRPANSGAVGADIAKCCTYIQPAIFDNNWSYRDDGRYYTGSDEAIPVDRRGVNPLFVNAAAGDFHLQASSPVCGFGAFPCGGVVTTGLAVSAVMPTSAQLKAVQTTLPTATASPMPVPATVTQASIPTATSIAISQSPSPTIPATSTSTETPTPVSPVAESINTVSIVKSNSPVITSNGSLSIAENTAAVTTVTATDTDLPAQTLTYSISGGTDSALFSINSSSGELIFIAAPNFEAPVDAGTDNIYNVAVQVSDGTLTATQDIVVTVTAIDDNTPAITSTNGNLLIAENTTVVTTVTATDADLPAETLTYSIVGGADLALFNINSSSGELTFITAPDFEVPTDAGIDNVYNVTVQASDGVLTVAQEIAITVAPVTDNSPVITSNASLSIAENTAAVVTVTAADADLPAGTLTYSISGGTDSALFSINSSTGELTFITAPDLDVPTDAGIDNIYNVTIQAFDGTLTATQDIVVTVTAIDDNNPAITSNGNLSIAENTATVTTVTAADADLPAETLTYSIVGGADLALFNINSSSGELTFITAPDFEVPTDAGMDNIYNVTVQASDGTLATTQDIVIAVIAVTDNSPVITSNGSLSIAENSAAVTTVTATDADLPAETLTYSISGGADSALFSINSSSGELTFVAAPDFEVPTDAGMDNIYNVTVQVSDGTITATQDIVITVTSVNDNGPVTTSNGSLSIVENTTAVTTVTATDADLPAQALTYSISSGADSAFFNINSSSGELTFIAAPDFEAPKDAGMDNVYNITVQASDGMLTVAQDIVVTVTAANDNTPVITSNGSLSIAENTTAVTTVTATDADLPVQTLTYSISGGADSTLFSINSSTGELTFITAPDFEVPTDAGIDNIYNVIVLASDGTLAATQNVAITIKGADQPQ